MFGRPGRQRTQRTQPPAVPGQGAAGADWSSHRELEDAVRAYLLHPDIALEALGAVLGRRPVRAFTLERVVDINANGTSVWQEAAVCDDHRLVLWHSEDMTDASAPGGTVLDSSVQVIPLGSVSHVGIRTLVGTAADGGREMRGAYVFLATPTLQEIATVRGEEGTSTGRFRQEAYRFSKSLDDGGAGQIQRLLEFAHVVAERVLGPR
jgi:hypothetical protein